jgi:hypothetical protein
MSSNRLSDSTRLTYWVRSASGEVFAFPNAIDLEQILMVLRASLMKAVLKKAVFMKAVLLEFEVDAPVTRDLMALEKSTGMIFKRVQTSSIDRTMHPSLQGKALSLRPESQVQGKV